MKLNRNSPVPLWVALCFGAVILGTIYAVQPMSSATAVPTVLVNAGRKPDNASASVSEVQVSSIPAEHSSATPVLGELKLVYPTGGEELSLEKTTRIQYTIGRTLPDQLGEKGIVELYLLDTNNILVGYIGKVDTATSTFNWDPRQLLHNGGMDMSISAALPGQYRILLLARQRPTCTYCGLPDTLDSPVMKFDNGLVENTESPNQTLEELGMGSIFASDVSRATFDLQ